jgi:hypothetical protein
VVIPGPGRGVVVLVDVITCGVGDPDRTCVFARDGAVSVGRIPPGPQGRQHRSIRRAQRHVGGTRRVRALNWREVRRIRRD